MVSGSKAKLQVTKRKPILLAKQITKGCVPPKALVWFGVVLWGSCVGASCDGIHNAKWKGKRELPLRGSLLYATLRLPRPKD